MSTEIHLEKFVRRATQRSSGYTRLTLVQVTTTGMGVVRHFDLKSDYGYGEEDVSNLVSEILSSAQEDADGHSSLSTYVVRASKGVTFGERSPKFRLRSQNEGDDDMSESEPATAAGALAQSLRHNEVLMRLLVQQQEISSRQSTDIIARLTDREKHYEDRHWDNLLRSEEMLSEKEARDLERMRAIAKEKRLEEAFKVFKPMVPLLMARFNGTPKEAKAGLTLQGFKELVSTISPEEMKSIADILGPKSLALAEIYMEAHKDEDEPEAAEGKH